jgi:hypothetical protein
MVCLKQPMPNEPHVERLRYDGTITQSQRIKMQKGFAKLAASSSPTADESGSREYRLEPDQGEGYYRDRGLVGEFCRGSGYLALP